MHSSSVPLLTALAVAGGCCALGAAPPSPEPWPEQFHATLLQNRSGALARVELFYDFKNGKNYNLIYPQLNETAVLYDLEFQNGSTYYYSPNAAGGAGACFAIDMGVGLLKPGWMGGAKYLGSGAVDGFAVDVFNQTALGHGAYFATYYNHHDADRGDRPVMWRFFDNAEFTVLSFTPGVPAPDIHIPVACPFKHLGAAEPFLRRPARTS